ncbi:nucleoside diphosphate kinase 7 isoform X2 [Pelobates cultripes]|uniref:Nucleoside diphosphate kinase n=1 Tax=Pelobates cultripes TaxID=61616 RepID=A0AAD1QYV4_PELCU|nr:nucleoside diphosphate kinase 7 isoform X2 [Pelobates cultripes]
MARASSFAQKFVKSLSTLWSKRSNVLWSDIATCSVTLAMIKPDAVMKMGSIIEAIFDTGFIITKAKMVQLNRMEAMDFYSEHQSKSFFTDLINFMTSGPIIALEVIGDDAVSSWRKLLGPTNSCVARSESPGSIRARFGTDGTRNAAHGSDSIASAARELEFFFPSSGGRGPKNTARFTDCTCCIIKPHAVSEGLTGKILNEILSAGFDISAMQMFTMEKANAEEFFEIYKGVVAEYNGYLSDYPITEVCVQICNTHSSLESIKLGELKVGLNGFYRLCAGTATAPKCPQA